MPLRRRKSGSGVDLRDGIAVSDLIQRHLLLVPDTVPAAVISQRVAERMPGTDLLNTGEVTFGRHSRLTGPYQLSLEDARDAAVPMPWSVCYCLETPIEREDPPPPGVDDRDGFAYAFPHGLPWRDEGRALHLLVSLARRLAGAVRVAGSLEVIMPDPERAVDRVVHAPGWLSPEDLLDVVSHELPGARLAVEGQDWYGPSDAAYSGELVAADIAGDPLTLDELDQLHAAADERDIETLSGQDVIDGFAIVAEIGWDGTIEVLVHLTDRDEPAVAGEPWAADEFVTYEVRWVAPDPRQRERRYPSELFLASRARVAPLVATVSRAIVELTGGVVLDEDGFRLESHPRR